LRRLTTSILIAAALACGRNEAGARLRVPAPRSEVAGSIAQVRVRVTGAGVDREHALSPQSGEWEAFFGDLPAAEELLFHGEALDAEGATLFAGDADPVILSPGESANLRLTLASLAPAAPFADHAPRIDFLTAPDVIGQGQRHRSRRRRRGCADLCLDRDGRRFRRPGRARHLLVARGRDRPAAVDPARDRLARRRRLGQLRDRRPLTQVPLSPGPCSSSSSFWCSVSGWSWRRWRGLVTPPTTSTGANTIAATKTSTSASTALFDRHCR